MRPLVDKWWVCTVAGVAIVLGYCQTRERVRLPEHMTGHPVEIIPDLLSDETANELVDTLKTIRTIPSNVQDVKFYKARHYDIGEAVPMPPSGVCKHPLMVPNLDKTKCALAGRVDIAKHYLATGGSFGKKEKFANLVSRLSSFGIYQFDLDEYPIMRKVFHFPAFTNAAKLVCPADKQVLDPAQLNFIVQVPGQTVATHIDAVYFWGATRFDFPQWLLTAMKFSGLFEDRFVDQVQVVGYIHPWTDVENRGGEFVYWRDNAKQEPDTVAPTRLAGTAVDGSKIAHAATEYRSGVSPPVLDKSKENYLLYNGSDTWQLYSGDEILRTYTTDDLRISIVYRAKCFESEEAKTLFHNYPEDQRLTLDQLLRQLYDDLVAKNVLGASPSFNDIPRLDLALAILNHYITYPLPAHTLVPYNVCMLPKVYPQANSLFLPSEVLLYFLRSRKFLKRWPLLSALLTVAHSIVRNGFVFFIALEIFC
ncbi:hypothetical protein DIPPA_27848 [Diplonema papillatum]|nr:hypothetical protein DIPPA_27848 [Diplonema papillatum]|eukprot:gene4406-6826_t